MAVNTERIVATDKASRRGVGQARIHGPQDVFGLLLRRYGVPDHYQSDLYHDAIWLLGHWDQVTAAGTFYYVRRESGTHIGLDRSFVISTVGVFEDVVHAIELCVEPTAWKDEWLVTTREVCDCCGYRHPKDAACSSVSLT